MEDLTGRDVEVFTADTTYRGILVELGEASIHLQSKEGWIEISVERVVEIRESK